MYRIGQFSRLCHVPVKTLRYYAALGLLRPAQVDRMTGYRSYAGAQVAEVNRILVFKDLGFSLREIRALVADRVPTGQIRAMLVRKQEELGQRVERERARLARAAARLDLLEHSGEPAVRDVAIRDTGSFLVASLRATIAKHADCQPLFEELERGVGRHPRGAIWHGCADGEIDCEALAFLPAPVRCKGRVGVRELRAQRVASRVYRGDEDYPRAYRAIRAWLVASGVAVIGPKREIFLEERGPVVDSATEIQFPIATDSSKEAQLP